MKKIGLFLSLIGVLLSLTYLSSMNPKIEYPGKSLSKVESSDSGAELIDQYTISSHLESATVTILRRKDDAKYFYHVMPPEYTLPEEQYFLLHLLSYFAEGDFVYLFCFVGASLGTGGFGKILFCDFVYDYFFYFY